MAGQKPSGCVWVMLSWDQIKEIELRSENRDDGAIARALQSMHLAHQRAVMAGTLKQLPDWSKPRPWCVLSFQDENPAKTYRYGLARSVSTLSISPNDDSIMLHVAHAHGGNPCIIDSNAAIVFRDEDVWRIPVNLAVFHSLIRGKARCSEEPSETAGEIYSRMAKAFPGRQKYVKPLAAA